MAASKIGIVYSVALKKRRLLCIPDDDSELAVLKNRLRPGEGYIEQELTDYNKRGADAALAEAIGAALPDRCVAVHADTKLVAATLAADPAIDSLPDHTLHLSDIADFGDRLTDGGTIERRYVKLDHGVNVVEVVWQDIKLAEPPPPIGGYTVPSKTLQIGDKGEFKPEPLGEAVVIGL